jgi:glycosyltransferase involved in cell wall biosynthesis
VNVVYLIDTLEIGGAEKSLLEITSRFSKYTPVFITLFSGDQLKPEYEQRGIKVISLNLKHSYDYKKIADKVLPVVRSFDPVILHATLFRSNMVSRELKSKLGVPLVNSLVSNSYSFKRYKALLWMLKLKLFAVQLKDLSSVNKVDLFISNSQSSKKSARENLFIPERKIKVIYRGRQAELFQKNNFSNHDDLVTGLDLSGKKVFLSVGRLLKYKGQFDLINAFQTVVQADKNAMLLIAGEGIYRERLEEQIKSLNLQQYVKLLGMRSDVPVLLNRADFFVFPSYNEGLPGALIEAMFSKTPIIASNIAENLECVDDSMALIHKKGNVRDLTSKLVEAMKEKEWRNKTELAHRKAIKDFEIGAIVKSYELTYDNLIIAQAHQ